MRWWCRFFGVRGVMKMFLDLFHSRSSAVRVQIIQTVSIMLMNITNQRSLCMSPCTYLPLLPLLCTARARVHAQRTPFPIAARPLRMQSSCSVITM
ncbi:MAG: hypothetical protein EOO65_03595 [Methanosarcinales archaeon]|nr:MAG: hypothetical protein EOO65_03595 [Methanosarcinales archaeon]